MEQDLEFLAFMSAGITRRLNAAFARHLISHEELLVRRVRGSFRRLLRHGALNDQDAQRAHHAIQKIDAELRELLWRKM